LHNRTSKIELKKQEALIAEIQEKFYNAIPVLGKEGNYDFILPAASAEKFSNVVDVTEKVLQKIKTE
jgi:Skp family chaperone for outer membrane proteins